jgi:hypothetical protein
MPYILLKPQRIIVMDKNDIIVTDVLIQALKMDDTIKRQEIQIERLKSDKAELLIIISKMKTMLVMYAPASIIKQLEMFNL